MIPKIRTGSYVYGMVQYNNDKLKSTEKRQKSAIFLGVNNIVDGNMDTIVNSILGRNNRNKRVKNPNLHISLNFHKNDVLSDTKIYTISKDYMKQMGYDEQPYAVYRHLDKEHPHVHIVSTQINKEGKKINDSHIYYRSQKLARELEEKYSITKAVQKNEIFEKKDIHIAIYEHLEHGKYGLLPLMKRVLSEIMDLKPTNEKTFEKLLFDHQLKRIISTDELGIVKGHSFYLVPIEYLSSEDYYQKSEGIKGNDLDSIFSYHSINEQLRLNNEQKKLGLKNMIGKVYSIVNSLPKSSTVNLSEFELNLKKKGIGLLVKRSQTGSNSGAIFGLLFKDKKSGITYSASDLKLKTKDFLKNIIDDLKNQVEDIKHESKEEQVLVFDNESLNNKLDKKENLLSNIFENCLYMLSSYDPIIEDEKPLKKKRRRKKGK